MAGAIDPGTMSAERRSETRPSLAAPRAQCSPVFRYLSIVILRVSELRPEIRRMK